MGELYCELAIGNVATRGIIKKMSELPAMLSRQSPNSEVYRSLYLYDEEILEHMRIRKSVRGYRGKYYLDRLVVDIDKGTDTDERTLIRAREFVALLLVEPWEIPLASIGIYFSGRGYHISLPDIFQIEPSQLLPQTLSATMRHHFKGIDDIYKNATRLLRIPNSINLKSNLYKRRLSFNELMNYDYKQIMELAHSISLMSEKILNTAPTYDDRIVLPLAPVQKVRSGSILLGEAQEQFSRWVTCMQKVHQQGEMQGERHQAILHLSSAWRRAGVPEKATADALKIWASSVDTYEVESCVHDVYSKGYRYGCNDPFMQKYCDANCIFYTRKNYAVEARDATEMSTRLTQYAHMVKNGFGLHLHEWLGLNYQFTVYPGEVMILFGDTGIGKSTLLMNIAVAFKDLRWLWLSLENTESLTFRRMAQIELGMSKEDILDLAHEEKLPLDGLHHITVVSDEISIDQLPHLVAEHNAHIVVVDTLDGLNIQDFRGDVNARTEELGRMLPGVARRCNTIFIVVHHISKDAAKQLRLTVHSGKGGSSVEQKADIAIGLTKYGERTLQMESLKGRDVPPFNVSVEQNFETCTFLPMRD